MWENGNGGGGGWVYTNLFLLGNEFVLKTPQ